MTAYAIYFDDGYPAALSVEQNVQHQEGSIAAADAAKPVTGAALFGSPADIPWKTESDPLVPVAFHPSGTPPLVASRMDTITQHHSFTIYRPVNPADWRPHVFVNLDEGGEPITTQWLVDTTFDR